MKICQIVPYYPYQEHLRGTPVENGYYIGGVERHAHILAHELAKRGHDVTVLAAISPEYNRLSEVENITVIRTPKCLSIYNSYLPISLLWHFDSSQYDIIHAHTPVPAIADIVALKNITTHTPFVLTYHNDITKSGKFGGIISSLYNMSFGKFLIQNSDRVIATTQSYADSSKLLKHSPSQVRVVPNGVDCNHFKPGLDSTLVKKKYGINPSDKLIVFVGRLDRYKGCEYLVKALPSITRDIGRVHLLLVGSGPRSSSLKQIATMLHIDDKITLPGYVKDEELPYIYASADVFVLPSISSYEGFGIVQLEALSSGKPVVTTTLPGVRDVDPNGVATLHVPPGDVTGLNQAITAILSDDILAQQMGQRGRELVLERYSWPKVVDLIEATYCEIL